MHGSGPKLEILERQSLPSWMQVLIGCTAYPHGFPQFVFSQMYTPPTARFCSHYRQ